MDTTRIDGRGNKGTVALVALAVAALLVALIATGTGADEPHHGIDGPTGVTVELLTSGSFVDDVAAQFRLRYDEPGANRGVTVMNLREAGDVVVAKVTFEPGGSLGWHTHPGSSVVSIDKGELEVTNASDCLTRTYGKNTVWIDPGQGNVHNAVNPGTTDTVAYVTFFGVPEDEPATEHVAPVDC